MSGKYERLIVTEEMRKAATELVTRSSTINAAGKIVLDAGTAGRPLSDTETAALLTGKVASHSGARRSTGDEVVTLLKEPTL